MEDTASNISAVQDLGSVLLALQLAAFGWRVIREIEVGDQGRKTWFPLPDWINIVAALTVTLFCIIWPFVSSYSYRTSIMILSMSYVLLAFHPINMACHYRLFSKKGRNYYKELNRDFPWITDHEIISVVASLLAAGLVGGWVYETLST